VTRRWSDCAAGQRDGPQAERDRGSATVLSAVVSIALLAILWLGYQLGSVVLTRHRAEGAADLAALAAAAYAPQGPELACARADWVARSMHATITSCRLDGWDARVELRATSPGTTPNPLSANARARAGPLQPRPPPPIGQHRHPPPIADS
jgi:secretion/DNA translocation related TadE-like protein